MNAIPQVNSALAAHAAGKLRADARLANARAFAARALGAGAILAGAGAALGLAFWGYAQIGAPVAPFAFTTHVSHDRAMQFRWRRASRFKSAPRDEFHQI